MIVLIGLLVLLCLLGAWFAVKLDQVPPRTPEPDRHEPTQRPWVHVETGPDSFHPVGAWADEDEAENR